MALDAKIKTELEKPLDGRSVRQRTQAGMKLDYIEGWHAIAEANRIFGFDGWTRETVTMQETRAPEKVQDKWRVGYMSCVRVSALGVMREGTGFGSGISRDLGDAVESAIKEAETDAMKRALMTFGNPFGLALYDRTRANVTMEADGFTPTSLPRKSKVAPGARDLYERIKSDIEACATKEEVHALMRSDEMVADLQSMHEDYETQLRQIARDHYSNLRAAEKDTGYVAPDFDNLPQDTQEAVKLAGTP